jgi:predicted transcriptional regulator
MARVVQARLDDDTDKMLEELRRRTRLSDSELVRRAIRSLAVLAPT